MSAGIPLRGPMAQIGLGVLMLRRELGLTQGEVVKIARKKGYALSIQRVSHLERGRNVLFSTWEAALAGLDRDPYACLYAGQAAAWQIRDELWVDGGSPFVPDSELIDLPIPPRM